MKRLDADTGSMLIAVTVAAVVGFFILSGCGVLEDPAGKRPPRDEIRPPAARPVPDKAPE